jgi:hypothetical protein
MAESQQSSTAEMRQILEALKAYKSGDFTVRLPTGKPGVAGEIAETFNALAAQSTDFAAEVTRVARELGPIGKLGCQMQVNGLRGMWAGLTMEVNHTAGILTGYIRDMSQTINAMVAGQPGRPVTIHVNGELDLLKQAINDVVRKSGS